MAGTGGEVAVNGSTIAILVLAVEYLACSYGRLYIKRWRPWR
jgi:hypothetical protein